MIDSPSQSALLPAGEGAAQIADLFYVMALGGVVIWAIVVGLAVYAIYRVEEHDAKKTRVLVIGGGAVFPTVVLTVLLTYGLAMLPDLQRPAAVNSQVIEVSGVRWWWRIQYRLADGTTVETANEIHLPVNEEVEFKLSSEDVIHSFWIPSLGGKTDMIPGRNTRLKLHPTKAGVYRGACAEFCGAAHAMMSFDVVVESREDFDAWLDELRKPDGDAGTAGRVVFEKRGCGACHAVRGTNLDGVVGPDLTHFGSRRTIGAAVMANTPENLRRWITHTHAVKPGVEMPAFVGIPADELDALIDYLGSSR
ncbi:cytochrome c oxidase subunit II [Allorhodopirellula heiligendammensis]|uniref:Cytochrome aa3 subunit 2 n=1 Tax=Allorhodopirellula heiligendammensis TaxID=2714739 RepID=A0A5C6C304_9BACT|nr:cytochrome c oxidase subunit II [Allorhodopirellula heiligendammensis]TWU18387.1 Cytochrome c oxidase subunit 2 precursor [Allorhodopirellula heiligendammensis]